MTLHFKQIAVYPNTRLADGGYLIPVHCPRARLYVDHTNGQLEAERFGSNADARDVARTLVRRIIKICRRKGWNMAQFMFALGDKTDLITHETVNKIVREAPKGVVGTAMVALTDYEITRRQSVGMILSIKPVLSRDSRGHFVMGIKLHDITDPIDRVSPKNRYSDAF